MKINKRLTMRILIGTLFVCSVCHLYAEGERTIIYQAYVGNEMGVWKRTIDAMHAERGKSTERELELLNYEYGYIGWCIGNQRKEEAKIYITRGTERIEKIARQKSNDALMHGYRSAFYGFQIGINKAKAPFVGPKSMKEARLSVEKDNQNAFGYVQLGNIEFYMPPLFGGSKRKALEYYLKAERLMAHESKGDWNYLSLMVVIAKAYQEIGEREKAGTYYRKVLAVEPEFLWVKNKLYPEFIKNNK